MLSANCERITITEIDGQITVVVYFVNSFQIWAPVEQQLLFDNGLNCQQVTNPNNPGGGGGGGGGGNGP